MIETVRNASAIILMKNPSIGDSGFSSNRKIK